MNSQNNHEVIVSGIHLELTPSLKTFVNEKAGRLFRHEERIIRIRVELECDRNALVGTQTVTPPYNFNVFITLLEGDGEGPGFGDLLGDEVTSFFVAGEGDEAVVKPTRRRAASVPARERPALPARPAAPAVRVLPAPRRTRALRAAPALRVRWGVLFPIILIPL